MDSRDSRFFMSIQIFLQGKFQGVRDFLESPLPDSDPAQAERVFIGRSWWIALLSEILPRALLAEFGLSRILLGSSGGGHFLLVLPAESQQRAEEFLAAAAADIATLSGGYLKLHWATTENLGDWAIVRRRLRDAMNAKRGAPLAALSALRTATVTPAVTPTATPAAGEFLVEEIVSQPVVAGEPSAEQPTEEVLEQAVLEEAVPEQATTEQVVLEQVVGEAADQPLAQADETPAGEDSPGPGSSIMANDAEPVAPPVAEAPAGPFSPGAIQISAELSSYFEELSSSLLEQQSVGWSPESPGRVLLGKGKQVWTIGPEMHQVPFTRHIALSEDGHKPVMSCGLAARAQGSKVWGVLRGDVDNFEVRLRRAQTIEEHVQLSVLYKQFFAGELEVLCSMPEFWRKVTILYTGGDDFAAFGAWDSLILLARELQRLFRRFGEQSLKDFPGGEAKTISMSLALAADANASLASVYQEAGRMLESAKCSSRDCFSLLGRVLEWRQLAGASDLKDTMVRIAQEFGGSTQFLRELAAFYREEVFSPVNAPRKREGELEKPWRLHRRVLRVLPPARDRELEKLRSSLISELVGKNASQIKLRPAGRVALEWARLLTESAQGPPGAHGE
jgi:CRISPR-associated protein Csm1